MIMTVGLYLVLMVNEVRWSHSMWNVEPRILQAVFLIYLELMIITGVALLFSTFTTSTLAAIFSIFIYVIGHISGDLVGLSQKVSIGFLSVLLKGLYYILPNLDQFDIKGQVVHQVLVEPSYFLLTSIYAFLYVSLLFVISSVIFQRREFK
jgi:ABC-type transport system involved in multi-copper enzyme maturation permease subunit